MQASVTVDPTRAVALTEFAFLTGKSYPTIWKMLSEVRIEGTYRIGNMVFVPRETLDAALKAQVDHDRR